MNQAEAVAKFMPEIESGMVYEKFTQVDARPAVPGEVVETHTSDGKETVNTAAEGDYVLRNLTEAGELYILSGKKLAARYKLAPSESLAGRPNPAEPWQRYQATGECQGVEYRGPDIEFEASWGENMVLKTGDMIVTPLPQKGEVYRIAAKEFGETYRPKA